MFSSAQNIFVYNNENLVIHTVDLDNIADAICKLADRYNIDQIRLYSNLDYAQPIVEEIKSTGALAYGKNNLNVEVYQNV
jgi:hypothetical protein